MPPTRDRAAAVQAADQVRVVIEPISCDACESLCYLVEGSARGSMGSSHWDTPLVYADHLTLSAALATASRALGQISGIIRERETRQYLLEHHPRLW